MAQIAPTSVPAGATLPARLETLREISGYDAEIVQDFGAFIRTAPDEDLFRTTPYRYAQLTGLSEQQAIDLFLYATHCGIFEFNWGVLCTNCFAFVTSPGGLRSLQQRAHCDICAFEFEVTVDDNVEVAFTVSPQVRRIRFHDLNTVDLQRDWVTVFYSPSRFAGTDIREQMSILMVASTRLLDAETDDLTVTLEPDARYMVMTPRQHSIGNLYVIPGETTNDVHFDIFDGRVVPDYVAVAPGDVHLTFHNRTGGAITVGVLLDPKTFQPDVTPEEAQRLMEFFSTAPRFLTGKQAATSQVFRELFRADSIPDEMGLAFKNMVFLFTDLKGSTAMYERVGDIRAYQLVREHFQLLRDVIAEFGGAIVKTIGDAVMASFADPLPALHAAIVINREMLSVGEEEELILRIGIHSGPCIAVESNDRLDYFGQTVNTAARVEAAAGAGEIVVTESIINTPGADEIIRAAGMTIKRDRALLRGLTDEIDLWRLS